MDDDLKEAMQKVVDYLDEQMELLPSRALADTSNYLQRMLNEEAEE